MQTFLLYRWLLEMGQNSSFCLNNTQITCSALITYNYLHYTELTFTLIKCPLFSKRYLETFISMAGEKKTMKMEVSVFQVKNIFLRRKKKNLLKGRIFLLWIYICWPFSSSTKPRSILLDVFMLPYIKLIKFTVNKNRITAILKQFLKKEHLCGKPRPLMLKVQFLN